MKASELIGMTEDEASRRCLDIEEPFDVVCFYEIDRDPTPDHDDVRLAIKIENGKVVKAVIQQPTTTKTPA